MAVKPDAAMPHVLVVDDDDRLRDLLRLYLTENGFVVSTAADAEIARGLLTSLEYDLIVLDVMMPRENGFELTRSLRSDPLTQKIPILLLTARGESEDRITGLEAGADDYLTKPFAPRELLLRINAILRRATPPTVTEQKLRFGIWIYDPTRDELRAGDDVQRLTGMEANLMRVLAASPHETISREALAEMTRQSGETINDRTIDVQVTRLRRKIEPDAKNPRYLITVRGEGYRLQPEV